MTPIELATDVAAVSLIAEEFETEIPAETLQRVAKFLFVVSPKLDTMEDISAQALLNHILTKYEC